MKRAAVAWRQRKGVGEVNLTLLGPGQVFGRTRLDLEGLFTRESFNLSIYYNYCYYNYYYYYYGGPDQQRDNVPLFFPMSF